MQLEVLMRRVSECPSEFLMDPASLAPGAIVSDLLVDLGGGAPNEAALSSILEPTTPASRQKILLILCWLLHDPDFRTPKNHASAAARLLSKVPTLLAPVTPDPLVLINQPDRQEELVRLTLKGLGITPMGETDKQAQARMEEISSVERERAAKEAREKLEKAREIEAALKKKAEEEAAARAWHE
jgi:hypothetical protein